MNEIRFPRLKFGVDLDPEAGSRPSLWSDQFWTLCHCDNGSKDPGRGHAARILCGILVLWGDTAARHTWGVLGLPTQPFTHMKGWRNPNNPGPMCSYVKLINALLMFLKDSCSTLVHFQIPSKIMFQNINRGTTLSEQKLIEVRLSGFYMIFPLASQCVRCFHCWASKKGIALITRVTLLLFGTPYITNKEITSFFFQWLGNQKGF